MPVYSSFDGLPSKASLSTMGYLPALLTSIELAMVPTDVSAKGIEIFGWWLRKAEDVRWCRRAVVSDALALPRILGYRTIFRLFIDRFDIRSCDWNLAKNCRAKLLVLLGTSRNETEGRRTACSAGQSTRKHKV